MPIYKFAQSAETDLQEIIDYTFSQWGQKQTIAYIEGFETLAESLAQSPGLGKRCDDLGSGLLAFPYRKHVLYYLKQAHGITIARILHERMNSELHFGDEGKA